MSPRTVDAVVIGAGPNGLVAANALADAGWEVLLLEAADDVGGAVRSAQVTAPGFTTDLFSAFYPLAAASPLMRDLDLGAHGLTWVRAPDVLAHALDDGRAALLTPDPARTAAGLDAFAAGDGDAWLAMVADWDRIRDPLLDALFSPFPPVAAATRLLRRTGVAGGLELARLAVLPVRRLAEEQFRGEGAALLLTGNAMHSDLPPDAAGSGLFGWLLAMLAQDVGFPVPRGGAGRLADALTHRFIAAGGAVRTGARVESVVVSGGRAVGVRIAGGDVVVARHAVLADVAAPALYRDLVGLDRLPARLRRDLARFQWDHATLKVNWALDRPVPWTAREVRGAGTVHLGTDVDGFVDTAADLAVGRVPRRPFLLLGQMTTTDPTRSPAGTESVWAYTHLPHREAWSAADLEAQVERMEAAVERVAPGFRDAAIARHVQSPGDFEAANANLVGGAINGGSAALHQQLFFRPTPRLGRSGTPLEGPYLASASAHPGGGVHGAAGWNAARAALGGAGRFGGARRRLTRTAWGRLLGER
ncbi:phytoene desaturase family protein [Pengzhenrongella frigida]|uniref:Pyridine nucleotide-disulfide oxidoreductase domain-containing protein 2 n=1 Tax=Pengzhenrongella frigida TaxID=1259133 RepID=A0A4Q5MZG2_9MICO|nr:NAD(P)/FAD-dependent oxidoreductase [Cellulomonas sp. HLT2-17]RYV51110.1 NAD(P)/FAD-dependent oxidoreductase [Cellulomonas sp. HLT2-17]